MSTYYFKQLLFPTLVMTGTIMATSQAWNNRWWHNIQCINTQVLTHIRRTLTGININTHTLAYVTHITKQIDRLMNKIDNKQIHEKHTKRQ